MTTYQLLFLMLFGTGIILCLAAIILTFYIGRTRIKHIDKAVYGYEFPHDSIFSLLIRVPGYAGAFLWEWSAKRSGLKGKIEQFDNKFRLPFKLTFLFFFMGMILMILGMLLDYFVGGVV